MGWFVAVAQQGFGCYYSVQMSYSTCSVLGAPHPSATQQGERCCIILRKALGKHRCFWNELSQVQVASISFKQVPLSDLLLKNVHKMSYLDAHVFPAHSKWMQMECDF